jgi:hypothetical protein
MSDTLVSYRDGWQPALVVFAVCCAAGAALGTIAQVTEPRKKKSKRA